MKRFTNRRATTSPDWWRCGWFARCLLLAAALLPLSQLHAQSDTDSAQLEQQLEAARQALDEAAHTLAELNMKMFKVDAEGEHSTRPMLGVLLEDFERTDGVKLVGVTPKGGAAAAGLQAGDLLIAVNGHRLDTGEKAAHELHEAMSSIAAGDTVAVEYIRDGGVQVADVTTQARGAFAMEVLSGVDVDIDLSGLESLKQLQSLQGLKEMEKLEALEALSQLEGMGDLSQLSGMVEISSPGGLELEDVTGDLARYFGIEKGVVVMAVPEDTRLKAGDVLLFIDGEAVESAHTALRRLGAAEDPLEAVVLREKQRVNLQIAAGTVNFGQPHVIRLRSGAGEKPDEDAMP